VDDVHQQEDLLVPGDPMLGEGGEDLPALFVVGERQQGVISGLEPVHADTRRPSAS